MLAPPAAITSSPKFSQELPLQARAQKTACACFQPGSVEHQYHLVAAYQVDWPIATEQWRCAGLRRHGGAQGGGNPLREQLFQRFSAFVQAVLSTLV